MKICIPTETDHGLDGELAGHFGRAPYFTVVDRTTGKVEAFPNENTAHGHGHCNPLAAIVRSGASTVLCRGLGRGALVRLQEAGVEVFVTDAERVSDAIASLDAAQRASLDAACGGGGCHGHEHEGH